MTGCVYRYGWWVGGQSMRGEWRFGWVGAGAVCAVRAGPPKRPWWLADS